MSDEDMSYVEPASDPADEAYTQALTIVQDNAVEITDRLRETHAAERGRAFWLSFTPLIERMGQRWEVKKDAVGEHVRSNFERRFHEPDWSVPIGELGWLFILPTMGPRLGAMRCAEIWAETGAFFIGEGVKINLPLYEVNALGIDQLSLKPIALDRYFDRDEHFSGAQDAPIRHISGPEPLEPGRSEAVGDMRPMSRPVPVASGFILPEVDLRVACAIEPVFEMKKLVIIGHRLQPSVVDPLTHLPLDARALKSMDWGKREFVDLANIEQGLKLLQAMPKDKRKVLIVVPAAFSTLASARVRNRITHEVTKVATDMQLKVLYEMRELGGVPPHRILEIVSLLRPFCMTVLGHVQSDMKAIRNMKECGLSGVCIDYDGLQRDEGALGDYLSALTQAAKASSGACMVQGFKNFRQMAVARLAGVTHATLKSSALIATGSVGRQY